MVQKAQIAAICLANNLGYIYQDAAGRIYIPRCNRYHNECNWQQRIFHGGTNSSIILLQQKTEVLIPEVPGQNVTNTSVKSTPAKKPSKVRSVAKAPAGSSANAPPFGAAARVTTVANRSLRGGWPWRG